jgi:S-adenosylmethionine decarboxylase
MLRSRVEQVNIIPSAETGNNQSCPSPRSAGKLPTCARFIPMTGRFRAGTFLTGRGTTLVEALGRHLLLELRDCDVAKLDDLAFLRHTMLHVAEETGATIIGEIFHQFAPQGVTGVVAIAESHLCIHTWPEFGYAAVDIFTCGAAFEPIEAASLIVTALQSKDPEITEIVRGQLHAPAPASGA